MSIFEITALSIGIVNLACGNVVIACLCIAAFNLSFAIRD